jgi:membrane protein implicated in regulation of membrane protease activity
MVWWQWMVIGGILLGAEMFAIDAQFYLVFIGVSAALVGLAGLFGIDMALWMQLLVFGALSLISMFTFRRRLYEMIRGNVEGFRDSLAGDSVQVKEDLAAGSETRLEYRGTKWTVRNAGSAPISGGSRAKVVKVDGLTLYIEAE